MISDGSNARSTELCCFRKHFDYLHNCVWITAAPRAGNARLLVSMCFPLVVEMYPTKIKVVALTDIWSWIKVVISKNDF